MGWRCYCCYRAAALWHGYWLSMALFGALIRCASFCAALSILAIEGKAMDNNFVDDVLQRFKGFAVAALVFTAFFVTTVAFKFL